MFARLSPPPFPAALLAVALVSCSPTLPPPSVEPAPAEAGSVDHAQLLLFPQADAEALLGRAVQRTSDGSRTIADARAPGCEVTVQRQSATFHTSRRVDAHSLTSLAASYAKLLALEIELGRENTADIDIDNVAVLRADMRGPCGDTVVDRVFVGHGRRSVTANAHGSGKAGVQVGIIGVAPGMDTAKTVASTMEWKDDQAYGFDVRDSARTEPLDLRATLPSIVTEGDEVEVHFESAVRTWLVVYTIDGAGHGDVLWPSNEEPAPTTSPDRPAVLPSAREREQGFRIKAALVDHASPSRETLVVYGFADKRDFDVVKPAAGSGQADGPGYAAQLTKQLQDIPTSRWARAVVSYVIQPASQRKKEK
jgi:hypothetical protein